MKIVFKSEGFFFILFCKGEEKKLKGKDEWVEGPNPKRFKFQVKFPGKNFFWGFPTAKKASFAQKMVEFAFFFYPFFGEKGEPEAGRKRAKG